MTKKNLSSAVPKTWGEFLFRGVKAVPSTLLWAAGFIAISMICSYGFILFKWYTLGIS